MNNTDLTTNNPNLDLFVKLVRQIDEENLINYLNNSWNYDKLKTLAIILNSRDRMNGKKEKNISNRCMLWLKKQDNKIYKKNIMTYITKYGCWNDLNYIIKHTKKNNYEYKLFAEQLKRDKELLETNENISLCSKWVINPNDNNVIKIARYLFDDINKYQEKYRKEYIRPLRTRLNLIETKLCNKDYENIDYTKIPAKALSIYTKAFKKHDTDKYNEYLENVANNKCKMKITGLLPYEIIKKYIKQGLTEIDNVLELQWKSYIDTYKNKIFENIIPIVDVSGSMLSSSKNIKPIHVSIAMGLLLAEINSGELHNKIMTFSEMPRFFTIEGETLMDKIKNILTAPFGFNTNFIAVANLLINLNISYKKIICFTDMQFDTAHNGGRENRTIQDIHNIFMNIFKENNKEEPSLIYWNLNGEYDNYPINNNLKNTSIISGFSEQLLNIVLECDVITPEILMEKTLEPYYEHIIL